MCAQYSSCILQCHELLTVVFCCRFEEFASNGANICPLDIELKWMTEVSSSVYATPLITDLYADGRKDIVVPGKAAQRILAYHGSGFQHQVPAQPLQRKPCPTSQQNTALDTMPAHDMQTAVDFKQQLAPTDVAVCLHACPQVSCTTLRCWRALMGQRHWDGPASTAPMCTPHP